MNNLKIYGNVSKINSRKLNSIDIDENATINKNSYPVNELYEDEKQSSNSKATNLISYKEMYEQSIKDPELFWGNFSKTNLTWFVPFTKVYTGDFKKGNVRWFVNGKLNACYNCVDRWAEKFPNKTAIIWDKDNPNEYKKISYQKLLENTCKVANLLKSYGAKKQDAVTIYLPMIPELAYSMLACARLGIIHNVVFSGFSAVSLSDRILDSKSKILITCDFSIRGGKLTKLKKIADEAMDLCGIIHTCIVFKNKTNLNKSDLYSKDLIQKQLNHSTIVDSQTIQDPGINFTKHLKQENGTNINENILDKLNNNINENMHYDINEKLVGVNTSGCIANVCINNNNNGNCSINDCDKDLDINNNYHVNKCYISNGDVSITDTPFTKTSNLCTKNIYSEKAYAREIENLDCKTTSNHENNNENALYEERILKYTNKLKCNSIIHQFNALDDKLLNSTSINIICSNFDENICVLKEGRDVDGSQLMKNMRPYCPIEYVDSEDYLFLLYTSGSTGKPKGIAHTTSGYLTYSYATCKYIFDIRENDVFGCVADIGWVTGHTYVLYGPLLNGITTIFFSSLPAYPDCGRYWNLIQTHKLTQFYTAPTALRALMKYGDHWVDKYDISSCRILGTVGEPINPEAWRWYYNVIGKKKCIIVDTYWQTETGGIVIAPIPNIFKLKPGCATLPFFGIELEILDSKTLEPLKGPNVCGLLCIKKPWPGMLRTIYGNHNRLIKTYFETSPNYYFTGDGAYRDDDGYYWISGRIDDTLNVSGHRLGAAELEHALVQHFYISEAAVVSIFHKIKGEGILCFVVKKKGDLKNYGKNANEKTIISPPSDIENIEEFKTNYTDEKLIEELKLCVRKIIGPIATPDLICIVPDLPKTRSGKIIRRILRCISNGINDYGDITTIANYEIIDVIKNKYNICRKKYIY